VAERAVSPDQPAFAGFEELLRPAVIKPRAIPSRRHSSAMLDSPRRPSRTTRNFSSAEYYLRVARLMFLTTRSDGEVVVVDFCLISFPSG
jgi:hypothetical protein